MVVRALSVGPWVLALGCTSPGAFPCQSDTECIATGKDGVCVDGYCAFNDPECPSGLKYGAHAGMGLAGQCVPPGPEATSTSGATPMMTTLPPGTSAPATSNTTSTSSSSGEASTSTLLPDVPLDCGDWWDSDWRFRQALVVTSPMTNGELVEFPAALMVEDVALYPGASPDGTDLRFVDEGGLVLAHEIERWTNDGQAVVWVQLPLVDDGATVTLYWGNDDAQNVEDASAVWSNGYIAVWHLLDLENAVGNGHNTSGDATPTIGQLAGAREFGPGALLDVPPGAALDDMFLAGASITAWIRPATWGGGDGGRILDRALDTQGQGGWYLAVRGDVDRDLLRFTHGFEGDTFGRWNTGIDTLVLNEWQHVGVTYTAAGGEVPSLYIDGSIAPATQRDTGIDPPDSDLMARMALGGYWGPGTRYFEGTIDEIRVSSLERSAGWIAAEYQSMTTGLFTPGDQQERPCAP